MRSPGAIRWGLIAASLAAALSAVAGCSREPALPPPDQVYVVRGRIEQLPEPGRPMTALRILHEPIDSFVRPDGKLGMGSMTMSFTPADSVPLGRFAVGDIVEFRWEVRRRGTGPSLITEMTKLPPGTELRLGRAGGG